MLTELHNAINKDTGIWYRHRDYWLLTESQLTIIISWLLCCLVYMQFYSLIDVFVAMARNSAPCKVWNMNSQASTKKWNSCVHALQLKIVSQHQLRKSPRNSSWFPCREADKSWQCSKKNLWFSSSLQPYQNGDPSYTSTTSCVL